jgi:hypothetical protein
MAGLTSLHAGHQSFALDIDNELTKEVRARAKRYGVSVDEVQVSDFTRSRSLRLIQPLNHHSAHAA